MIDENWQRRLNGEKLPIYDPPEKECGFYKIRIKPRSKQWLPCCVFKLGGVFYALNNNIVMSEAKMDAWKYGLMSEAIKNPISEQEYNELMEVYHG